MEKLSFTVSAEEKEKIETLIAKMTVDEKIGQLNQVGPSPVGGFEISLKEKKLMLHEGKITKEEFERDLQGVQWDTRESDVRDGKIGSFLGMRGVEKCNHMQRIAVEESRLGIPLFFGLDVVHGLRTIFPIPLAESCSFDENLFEQTASIAAKEAAATGIKLTFAPMIDVCRDARWGRIAEGAGEDTYLTSRFAAAKVRGFQGDDIAKDDKIAACAKHFVAYGAAIGGRDYNSADMSLQTLWETYLPPFKNAVDSGVASFMTSFNDLNGEPCTTSNYLLKDILRGKWAFGGAVISDSGAIGELIEHGTVSDRSEAANQALCAGIDIDMSSMCYTENLKNAVLKGDIPVEVLDDAVRRVLRLKFALGLFDHPYTDESAGESMYLCDEHIKLARDAGRRSIVLLKNDGILPLGSDKKIAVVGELAAIRKEMLGTWAAMGRGDEAVCLLDGLAERNLSVSYEECCKVDGTFDRAALEKAVKDADIVIAAVGEYADMSGEASSLCHIGLHGEQEKMLLALKELGKPFVTVLFNGRPLAVPKAVEISNALIEAWHLGSQAGNSICDVLFGDYNPSARLTATFPNHSGECPIYYNHVSTGRPTSEIRHSCKYMDAPLKPLFPFGYGLSYTDYQYSDLSLSQNNDRVDISVKVKNTGKLPGEETVQVYVRDITASKVRPVKELKAFGKVWLSAGEEKTVKLSVPKDSLKFYDMGMNCIFESGDFEFFAGHDSTASLSKVIYIEN
ncbi:MAG: glycoside hydrolase family 3 C-terminal domain-containing protein [Clostridia bacterium]|nr:glycoside hydrolase family 3 C-terminal domain-containing protein [Clostridia bacterium]